MKTILLLFILLGGALGGVSCKDEPPGKGATAELGYAFANPIAAKLETFFRQHGNYPVDLAVVAPDYKIQKPVQIDFGYKQLESGRAYDMYFAYRGPGMNVCHYTSAEKKWRCSGAY